MCCACLCFMLLFALVCPVVGWCCRNRLLLCSGCFAAIAPLGWMLRRHVARAVALPPVSPRSPLSGRCLAAMSVMAPHPRMLCRVDVRCLWRMLCRHGLFSSGCFVAVVVLAPLADALPSWLIATSQGGSLPPTLLEACSVDSAVPLHYWLPLCCILVSGSVGWGFVVEVPLVFFLLSVCACGISLVI